LRNVKKAEFDFKGREWKNVSSAGKVLIKSMLNPEFKLRISAVEAFNDPWMQTQN
jgi:hypothetical protein